jgi:hypothetical protein
VLATRRRSICLEQEPTGVKKVAGAVAPAVHANVVAKTGPFAPEVPEESVAFTL